MRKLLFCAVIAIAVLAGCQKSAKRAQVVGNIYTEEFIADDGRVAYRLLSVANGIDDFVMNNLYTKVVYNEQAGLILAYCDKTFICFTPDGKRRGFDDYKKIDLKDGYAELKGYNGISLYFKDKDQIYANFQDYSIVGDKIFAKGANGWGLYDMEHNYLQDMIYDKLYIINQKSAEEYDIIRFYDGCWELVGSDDSVYDDDSANEVAGLVEELNPTTDVGVLDISF